MKQSSRKADTGTIRKRGKSMSKELTKHAIRAKKRMMSEFFKKPEEERKEKPVAVQDIQTVNMQANESGMSYGKFVAMHHQKGEKV